MLRCPSGNEMKAALTNSLKDPSCAIHAGVADLSWHRENICVQKQVAKLVYLYARESYRCLSGCTVDWSAGARETLRTPIANDDWVDVICVIK